MWKKYSKTIVQFENQDKKTKKIIKFINTLTIRYFNDTIRYFNDTIL